MKKRKKLRIKSWKRFVSYSLACLILISTLIVGGVFAIAHIVTATESQAATASEESLTTSAENNAATPETQSNSIQSIAQNTSPTATVDTSVPAEDDPYADIKERLRNNDTDGLKVIFLTFDDGPSPYTPEVLDLLASYGIKATFFTNHHKGSEAAANYCRIVTDGHTLANHTSSHLYSFYSDPTQFMGDVQSLRDYQIQVTGIEPPKIFRFPGGSANANAACVQAILDAGYTYADWNVIAGDGSSSVPEPSVITQNIIDGCHEHNVSVVLCHAELKENTRAALPAAIETLLAEGYTFLPMEEGI
ncbi:MAG: peptidoglycan-N-acetylglucosamine deacetylase, partial [Eubacteriaceae bacterium]|nr:peptidoglycan-N-acetylglucosamine deacetylase [Eubacteriaceae bacterium]